jgi:hypothetical protein
MNAPELRELMKRLTPGQKKRVQDAGAEGYLWVWENVHALLGQGFTPGDVESMAHASCVAACELQLIVEGITLDDAGCVLA